MDRNTLEKRDLFWEDIEKPLVRFMIAPCPSLISVKHSIPSYPPLAIVVGSWLTRGTPEGRYGGALIQPSARMADWWTVRWCVGKRSVIVGQARNLNSYQKSLMRIKETPNKLQYTISEPIRCYKPKWYLIQNDWQPYTNTSQSIPFVVPIAISSLFAQSKLQQEVSSNSIRRIGYGSFTRRMKRVSLSSLDNKELDIPQIG